MAKSQSSAGKSGGKSGTKPKQSEGKAKPTGEAKATSKKSPVAKLAPKVAEGGWSATKSKKPPEKNGMPEEQPDSQEAVMTLSHDQIARRAYEIWQKRGMPRGQEHEHWQMAEAELQRSVSA